MSIIEEKYDSRKRKNITVLNASEEELRELTVGQLGQLMNSGIQGNDYKLVARIYRNKKWR